MKGVLKTQQKKEQARAKHCSPEAFKLSIHFKWKTFCLFYSLRQTHLYKQNKLGEQNYILEKKPQTKKQQESKICISIVSEQNKTPYLLGHQCSSPAWLLTSQQIQHESQPEVKTNTVCLRNTHIVLTNREVTIQIWKKVR